MKIIAALVRLTFFFNFFFVKSSVLVFFSVVCNVTLFCRKIFFFTVFNKVSVIHSGVLFLLLFEAMKKMCYSKLFCQ